jgi:hypothetical protein
MKTLYTDDVLRLTRKPGEAPFLGAVNRALKRKDEP